MGDLLQLNWVLVAMAAVILLLVIFWLFAANRRTRIESSGDDAQGQARRNQALIDAPPAAPVVPAAPAVPVDTGADLAAEAPADRPADGPAGGDDLLLIKGLGPKIAQQLAALGITRFSQIAAWDEADIDRIDAQLGRFQGRIRRDSWVEQARLLAAGDRAGFEDRFGRS